MRMLKKLSHLNLSGCYFFCIWIFLPIKLFCTIYHSYILLYLTLIQNLPPSSTFHLMLWYNWFYFSRVFPTNTGDWSWTFVLEILFSWLSWCVWLARSFVFSCPIYLGDEFNLSCHKVGVGEGTCVNVVHMDMSLFPCSLAVMSVVVTVWFVCKLLCQGGIFGFRPLSFWLLGCLCPISYGMFLLLSVLTFHLPVAHSYLCFISSVLLLLLNFQPFSCHSIVFICTLHYYFRSLSKMLCKIQSLPFS